MLPTILARTFISLSLKSPWWSLRGPPHTDGRDRPVNDNLLSHGTTRTENSFELLVDWILKESAKHNARVFIQGMNVGGRCSVFSSRGAHDRSQEGVMFPSPSWHFLFGLWGFYSLLSQKRCLVKVLHRKTLSSFPKTLENCYQSCYILLSIFKIYIAVLIGQ